jgi:hypothetical protein
MEQAVRKRDAEATRQSIFQAARHAFSHASYDQVTLREIAAIAEVDVALVVRYFGSKEELFAGVITLSGPPPTPPEDHSTYGEWAVRRMLQPEPHKDVTHLLALHHSVTNPRAAEIIREVLKARFIEPMSKYIGGPDGELRAALLLSALAGFAMMRWVVELGPATTPEKEKVVERLAPAIQGYVD